MQPSDAPTRNQREQLLSALLVEALHHRHGEGLSTSLRELHLLLDVAQPVALRIAHQLANEGVASIDTNLSDAFASQIALTPSTISNLERARRKNTSGVR